MAQDRANITVTIPETIQGEVLQALNRAGGVITNIRKDGEDSTAVEAAVPASGLAVFRTWLADYSKGKGRISSS